MLKFGDRGNDVTILQGRLNAAGVKVAIDGDFGAKTEAAVKTFQKSVGLVIDGMADTKTIAALTGQRINKLLKEADIQAAAELLEVDVATVKAVNRVESAGCGFLPDGRPLILFERHHFYRLLTEKYDKATANKHAANRPDICNTATGGYKGGAAEWPRYAAALMIDTECAQQATSWGLVSTHGL